jgi:hypothetical protein
VATGEVIEKEEQAISAVNACISHGCNSRCKPEDSKHSWMPSPWNRHMIEALADRQGNPTRCSTWTWRPGKFIGVAGGRRHSILQLLGLLEGMEERKCVLWDGMLYHMHVITNQPAFWINWNRDDNDENVFIAAAYRYLVSHVINKPPLTPVSVHITTSFVASIYPRVTHTIPATSP